MNRPRKTDDVLYFYLSYLRNYFEARMEHEKRQLNVKG